MKLFQQLLVAPAALGLLAPMAANAAELNINDVSAYSASAEEVKSISQFSDVYPTDWAYQALTKLAERHGCAAANPSGSLTRYEAAALINTCLGKVAQVNEEERRLINEFGPELAVIKGRVDGLEAGFGELEAGMFSTTTKLSGTTVFAFGGVDEVTGKEAVTFNYDTKISLDSSFTGEDLLKTRIRAGNFIDSDPFGADGDAALEYASSTSNNLTIDRAYYQFPVGGSLTATVGALVRQDDMLGVWPSSYPSDAGLDVLTYAGANDAYNLSEGAGAGITYAKDQLSASLVFVSDEAADASQGVGTEHGSDDITAQLAWLGDNFTVAAAYTTSDGGNPTDGGVQAASNEDFDAWGVSGVYNLDNGISINAGMGWKTPDKEDDTANIEDENTWSIGVVWSDFGSEGNNLGFAYGTAEGHRDDSGYDDPMAFEIYYSMAVSDNITVTPSFFNVEKDGAEDVSGGIVKTTFKF